MANLKLNYVTENALDEGFCDNVEITIYIFHILEAIMMESKHLLSPKTIHE